MNHEDPDITTLQHRKRKWDKTVQWLKMALGFYAFIVLTYLAIQGIIVQQQGVALQQQMKDTIEQVRTSQLANQENGNRNHEKTREYIECLFTAALLVPVDERTNINFDDCTKSADATAPAENSPTPQSSTSQPSTVPTPSAATPQKSDPPTTGAPPDPDPDNTPTPAQPNIVEQLLNNIRHLPKLF